MYRLLLIILIVFFNNLGINVSEDPSFNRGNVLISVLDSNMNSNDEWVEVLNIVFNVFPNYSTVAQRINKIIIQLDKYRKLNRNCPSVENDGWYLEIDDCLTKTKCPIKFDKDDPEVKYIVFLLNDKETNTTQRYQVYKDCSEIEKKSKDKYEEYGPLQSEEDTQKRNPIVDKVEAFRMKQDSAENVHIPKTYDSEDIKKHAAEVPLEHSAVEPKRPVTEEREESNEEPKREESAEDLKTYTAEEPEESAEHRTDSAESRKKIAEKPKQYKSKHAEDISNDQSHPKKTHHQAHVVPKESSRSPTETLPLSHLILSQIADFGLPHFPNYNSYPQPDLFD